MSRLISVASLGESHSRQRSLSLKVQCPCPADLPIPSWSPFALNAPPQLLSSAAEAERSPCTASRSEGRATPSASSFGSRALFHNALTSNKANGRRKLAQS